MSYAFGSASDGLNCKSLITTPTVALATTTNRQPVITSLSHGFFEAAGRAVTVEWASTDLKFFNPPSAPLAMLAGTNTPANTTSSSTATNQPVSISTGAKAGIGVGVSAVVLFLIALGAWLFVLRRRRRRRLAPSTSPTEKAELPGHEAEKKFAELSPNGERVEAIDTGRPPEMDDRSTRAELEGDFHGYEAPTVRQNSPRW